MNSAKIWYLLLVFLGGGAGSLLRVSISLWLQKTSRFFYPWDIFLINLVGSGLIGFVSAYLFKHPHLLAYGLLVGGFLGGFTTFSAFSEALYAMGSANSFKMVSFAALSVFCSLLACLLGHKLGAKIFG